MRFYGVRDEQPTDGLGRTVIVIVHLVVIVFVTVVVLVLFFLFVAVIIVVFVSLFILIVPMLGRHGTERRQHKPSIFNGFGEVEDVFSVLQDRVLIGSLQAGAVDDHEVGFCDRSDVCDAEFQRVRVGSGRDQCSHLDQVAADLADPVGDDLGRDHNVQWFT